MTTKVKMTEEQLTSAIIDTAHTFGWRVHHARPGRTKDGWRTPIQGDVGYPDLTMARRGEVLFVEVKTDTGKLTEGQYGWMAALLDEIGVDHAVEVWRPADWMSGRIVERLKP